MGSHAITWLVKQYRCVLGRMRVHQYLESHPTVAAVTGGRMKLEQLEDRVLLSGANSMATGTAANDDFVIKRDGGNLLVLNHGVQLAQFSLAATNSLTVDGNAGDDNFAVDLTGGDPYPAGGIFMFGGVGADTLTGSAGNDRFSGGPGADTIVGGGGVDTVDETLDPTNADADISMTATSVTYTKPTGAEVDSIAGVDKLVAVAKSLNRGTFAGQTVFMSGMPQWVEQGPGPALQGSRANSGATQVVAAHPFNAQVLFAGTVNGGVWKTEDGGHSWRPLTDQFPTLATSAMTISTLDADGFPVTAATPTDKLVIYVGTGTRSSFRDGGEAVGILKSTDGGRPGSCWATRPANSAAAASRASPPAARTSS